MEVQNLKSYLANVGMTMKQFGDLINYNPDYIRHVSSGKILPSFRMARDIRNATGGIVDLEAQTKKRKKNKSENNHDDN